jgi:hypothetical protein
VTAFPLTGFPPESFSTTVIVDVDVPSAVTVAGFALTVEVAALTGPGLKVTVTVPALLLRVKAHVVLPVVQPELMV